MDLWEWRKNVEDGDVQGARTNGSVVMMDQQGNDVARWDFENAWPSKITGPAVKSEGSDFGIEELTVVHEYIKRTQ
jgi:phage tail-like protein